MASEQKDEIANKLAIVNKIIKKGFNNTVNTITEGKEFCISIKNANYCEVRESLISEMCALVCN